MKQVSIAALSACLAYGAPAWAQDAGPAPARPATATPAQDEIVVTAQRRTERLENVPISITAVTGKALQTAGITRLEDLAKVAPNVLISRTGIYNQPSIRGISTQLVGPGVENNIALYVDGFYRPFQQELNFDFTNVQQISILKGPQGTLFGRNATGGAILIDTIKPSLTTSAGDMGVSYARFNDFRAWANASTPLVKDKLAIGLSGYYRRSDGYIKDDAGFNTAPVRNHEFSGTLVAAPIDNLKITAEIQHTQISDGLGLAATSLGHNIASFYLGVPAEMGDYKTSLNHPIVNRVRVFSQNLKIEYDAGPVKITSLTGRAVQKAYVSYDLDGTTAYFYDQHVNERDRVFTQEVDIASNNQGRLSWVLGGFYFDAVNQTSNNNVRQFPSPVYRLGTNVFAGAKSAAGFADVTYELVDHLFVTGGVRYSWEQRHVINSTAAGAPLADVTKTFHSLTPRAVVRYELTPHSNVYASFSKGFKSGGVNYIPPYNAIKPEKLTAYEIGYKMASGGFRFDTSAYYYDYKDLQVSYLVVYNGGQQPVVANAATARVYGAEAQFSGKLSSALDVHAAIAYNHARYRSFPNAPANPIIPATGLNGSGSQDLSGQPLLRAPDWSGNIGGDYTIPIGESNLVLSGNLSLTSGYAPTNGTLDAAGRLRYWQKGYALLSLQAQWNLPGGHAYIALYGNNVTDKKYYIVKNGNGLGDYGVLGEPATYGVRASYRF